MSERRIEKDFYFDLGTLRLWELYETMAKKEGFSEEEISLGVDIPSRSNDYSKRFGLKGKPYTKSFEITRTISILHASKLCTFKFLESLICRVSSGCLQWASGVIPKGTVLRLRDKEKAGLYTIS